MATTINVTAAIKALRTDFPASKEIHASFSQNFTPQAYPMANKTASTTTAYKVQYLFPREYNHRGTGFFNKENRSRKTGVQMFAKAMKTAKTTEDTNPNCPNVGAGKWGL